jgi:hypothetical protein
MSEGNKDKVVFESILPKFRFSYQNKTYQFDNHEFAIDPGQTSLREFLESRFYGLIWPKGKRPAGIELEQPEYDIDDIDNMDKDAEMRTKVASFVYYYMGKSESDSTHELKLRAAEILNCPRAIRKQRFGKE